MADEPIGVAEAIFPSSNATTVENYDGTITGRVPEVNPTTNIPLMAQGLFEAGGAGGFTSDPLVYERFSQGTVEAQPIAYSDQRVREMEDLAQSAAALQCQGVRQYASQEYKKRLETIVDEAGHLPKLDVVATVDGQRMTIGYQATSAPASFTREQACVTLKNLLGNTEKAHKKVIEVLSCARSAGPMFAVPQRGNPKEGNPVIWLSQQLAAEVKKQEIYNSVPKNSGFDPQIDGNANHAVFKTIMALFSQETARTIQMIGRVNNSSMLMILEHLIDKICADRRKVVNPPYTSFTDFLDIIPQHDSANVAPAF